MLRDHGEEGEVPVAVVDEAVAVAHGAVVAVSGGQGLVFPVIEHLAGSGQDVDDLAARVVSVKADGEFC